MKHLIKTQLGIESQRTLDLMKESKIFKKQGFLNKEQLLKILHWKSPRPLKHYSSNSEKDIIEITKLSLSTKNDTMKLHILTALKGVNYPSASAILMFYDPIKFPVLDIRVWQQLYKAKYVNSNEKGSDFKYHECEIFYTIIRELSNELNLSARQVEKRIFDIDQDTRIGNLR